MEYTGANNANWDIEKISFDDGFITTLTDHLSWTWGTTGSNTITGTANHDVIIGKAGNDTLSGSGGNDDMHGGADTDTLSGGDGADFLHGGLGNDRLSGQDGQDTLFGGDGADTFVFESANALNNIEFIEDFSPSQSDVIDIRSVLSGYNPLSHVLTDFVKIEDGSNNSILSVDIDGTGTTNTWVRIAAIQGVTGLTDEAALVASGNLLVA
jgi:Ca2+-binding RTX toxin-like protein